MDTSGTMSLATMDDGSTNKNNTDSSMEAHLNNFEEEDHSTSVYNINSSSLGTLLQQQQQQQQEQQGATPSGLWDIEEVRQSLRCASIELSKRGLKLAAKWAAEQLVGLPLPSRGSISRTTTTATHLPHGAFWSTPPKAAIPNAAVSQSLEQQQQQYLEDQVIFAQSLFDMGEFDNAAYVLSHQPSTTTDARSLIVGAREGMGPPHPNLNPYGLFLRAYALYLSGERRKEQDLVEITRDPLERSAVTNTYLPQLRRELSSLYQQHQLDPFGIYVYGIVLKELSAAASSSTMNSTTSLSTTATRTNPHHPTVQSVLLDSLRQYPYNWSAWLDLASVCINNPLVQEEVEVAVSSTNFLAHHWMYYCFLIHIFLEQQQEEQALQLIHRLLCSSSSTTTTTTTTTIGGNSNVDDESTNTPSSFPKITTTKEDDTHDNTGLFVQSNYLKAMTAVAYYNLRDFDTAQEHFLELCQRDPFRLDQMDIFSNILYVKESKAELSHLAHCAIRNDKYRPETCCIVGNYYSLKRQHEKAVQYFQRALKLDRSYLSAWTLMGHEFVEMKNTAAAIEAYRRAVDISPRDYRAWYGLGQTYEILNMQLYALFYYRKAAALRPYDARMWCPLGECYLKLNKRREAIRTYERAFANYDREGIATQRLATLYKEDGDFEKAAKCYQRHLELQQQLPSVESEDDDEENDNSLFPPLDEASAEALLYLAFYHKEHRNFTIAMRYASRLLEYPGPEKEEAKALLREIRSRIDSERRVP